MRSKMSIYKSKVARLKVWRNDISKHYIKNIYGAEFCDEILFKFKNVVNYYSLHPVNPLLYIFFGEGELRGGKKRLFNNDRSQFKPI